MSVAQERSFAVEYIFRKAQSEDNMFPTMQSLGLDKLNVEQRLVLVQEIWDSIEEQQFAIPLTDTTRAEIERRVAKYETHPQTGHTL